MKKMLEIRKFLRQPFLSWSQNKTRKSSVKKVGNTEARKKVIKKFPIKMKTNISSLSVLKPKNQTIVVKVGNETDTAHPKTTMMTVESVSIGKKVQFSIEHQI